MAYRINFDDKVGLIPRKVRVNQCWDADLNEIKQVVNNHADEIETFNVVITIGGRPWTLIKANNIGNESLKGVLEINDYIQGSPYDGSLMMLKWLGGDQTQFTNPNIYQYVYGIL